MLTAVWNSPISSVIEGRARIVAALPDEEVVRAFQETGRDECFAEMTVPRTKPTLRLAATERREVIFPTELTTAPAAAPTVSGARNSAAAASQS